MTTLATIADVETARARAAPGTVIGVIVRDMVARLPGPPVGPQPVMDVTGRLSRPALGLLTAGLRTTAEG
jgi:hypothetical protein